VGTPDPIRDERYFGIDKTDHAIVTRGRRKDNGTKQAIVESTARRVKRALPLANSGEVRLDAILDDP